MLEVQKMKLEQALRVLDSVKDHIRFAVEWNGHTYGNSELVKPKPHKGKGSRALRYPMGTLSSYIGPYLDTLAKDGVVEIPWGEFDPAQLGTSVSGTCCNRFGKGKASRIMNKKNRTIEVWLDMVAMQGTVMPNGQIDMFNGGPTAA